MFRWKTLSTNGQPVGAFSRQAFCSIDVAKRTSTSLVRSSGGDTASRKRLKSCEYLAKRSIDATFLRELGKEH
ncbi:hypothetical protein SKAU_G00346710 [Synaphobranchus kaupii]|uniref:Uncharacterized protein n=1 Tax=Synaphobranchus kaupii TaxID=118154 RepID=A0A9Q1EJT9_SYNKA|nr:hypothetical protein SKAU_G00346710 [Synaphobranchus kaupii]